MPPVPVALLAFAAGFLGWGAVEYGVHGILAHRFRTFVSPLHAGHHRDPRAVFTSPLAWMPAAAALGVPLLAFGGVPGALFLAGLLAGFARYEVVHWRIHFRAPRNTRERRRRAHHLAHHLRNPRACHGVTTRLWDRLLGTLPPERERHYAALADLPPLQGKSNLAAIWSPRTALAPLRRRAAADRGSSGDDPMRFA